MEKEQEEAQYLDVFGVIRETINIVASWSTIFAKITFFHILPLSIIFLSHLWISQWLFGEILYDQDRLMFTRVGTRTYNDLRDLILNEEVLFFLFTILYYIFVIIFSLVSTSAVVYTIACIYTGKDLTFKKLMRVIPRVWQRLMVTFIWSSFVVFAYNMMSCLVFAALVALGNNIEWWEFWIFFIAYLLGLIYIGMIWQLACVVSVLEDLSGIQAMAKSKDLIQGKVMVAGTIYIMVNFSFVVIQLVVMVLGPDPIEQSGNMYVYGILCITLVVLILFGLVSQTIIYFVCKSYHHETIDKPSLADHLEEYAGEYMPLIDKDVQLGAIQA